MPEIGGEIGRDREFAKLLKTGQTTQYGGYADDGYYEKGVSKQYDILTTGRYAGTTSITLNAKTDVHSNNCVYDKRTKLMWSRYAVADIGPDSNGRLPWTTNGDGEGLFTYVAAANAAELAGYADWRVPNIYELQTLQDYEAPTPLPDATAFPSLPTPTYYWTSTTRPDITTYAMDVHMGGGYNNADLKTSNCLLLLVRGG